MRILWNRAVSLALVVGSCLTLSGCGSAPGHVTLRHSDGLTGTSEYEHQPSGPTTTLPAGWTPDGEQTITITIDGKTYTFRICVARNSGNPNCIYMNLGGCGATEGWFMYCRTITNQPSGPGGGTASGNPGGGQGVVGNPEQVW